MTIHPAFHADSTIGRLRFGRVTPRMLGAASAVAISAVGLPAVAQQAAPPARLPAISVEGQKPAEEGYKVDQSASPKFTAPLLETPKSVTVIPQELIQERGATSMSEVLRTTPGISLGAGEGGTAIGDRAFIRGFDALSSTYVDGLRDTGAQSRDPFNLEQVEITKGTNGTFVGRGSTGGTINLVSKTAKAQDFNAGSATLGTDLTKRLTVDINRVIDGNIGIRLNAMAQDSEVAGRDEIEATKYGFAPTVTFGLNKPTRLTLSYYHYQLDDIPDYGHPFDPSTGKPVAVSRDNFYGLVNRDFRETYYDGATARIEHDLSDAITVSNTTRYVYAENKYIVTKPNLSAAQLAAGTVARESRSRNADTETIVNQTDVKSEFEAGGFRHSAIAGIELSREQTANRGYALDPATVTGDSLYNPNPSDPYAGTIGPSSSFANSTVNTQAVYVLDTIALAPQWDLNLGLRLDNYDTNSVGANTNGAFNVGRHDTFLNYQTGLVYKPASNGSVYASYSTSSNPSGGSGGEGGDESSLGATNDSLKPEENVTYELGTKWEVLNRKLALTAAVFRTEKENARVSGINNTAENLPVGKQRVDGFEIGASGNLTDKWKLFGGYTFLKSKIVDDGPNASNDGHEFPNIAPHNISLWTTYDLTADWTVGAGAIWMAERYANAANTYRLPNYWRFDAMAAYRITPDVDLQLNVMNIFDETIYDSTHNGQFAPVAPGRVALLTTNFKF
ncbi:TonB-dependent siderophore receptor [Ferrovibrio sp.]|uniref:TonB-dependent receptor n=1 Tax=Ferrovibrio sp. TaxID=1917215 RepID=UPI000CB5C1F6|nr:TonB-dependent siderophore receptor [Ferrovibrio sp.]PJI43909.1 MAG: TonB-dependent siderophore receptor [Ferrovibrio sp.]